MILILQIFDVIANENVHYKWNEFRIIYILPIISLGMILSFFRDILLLWVSNNKFRQWISSSAYAGSYHNLLKLPLSKQLQDMHKSPSYAS